jgi:hypothetical protein
MKFMHMQDTVMLGIPIGQTGRFLELVGHLIGSTYVQIMSF